MEGMGTALAIEGVPDHVVVVPAGGAAIGEPEALHDGAGADVREAGDRDQPPVVREPLAPELERGSTALGRKAAAPGAPVEHPPHLDRRGLERPVVVAQEPDPADQPSRLEVLDRPVAEPVLGPLPLELLDLRARPLDAVGTHVLEVAGLTVDLRE